MPPFRTGMLFYPIHVAAFVDYWTDVTYEDYDDIQQFIPALPL